jgi:hypothetical protein
LYLIVQFHPNALDFSKLNKANREKNLQLAFDVAESLGVAPLLDVEDIVSMPKPEQFSIMTYLSQFYHVFGTNKKGGKYVYRSIVM